MIRTTCPKCGREGAVADYLALLPILCNGCGTRVTAGDRLATVPLFPPPVAPPPPPKAVPPPPPPPPPPKKAKPRVPPPLIERKPTPLPPKPPPEPEPELVNFVAASPVFLNTDPTTAFPGVGETPDLFPEPPDDDPPVALAPAPAPPDERPETQPATPRAVPVATPKPAPLAAEPFPLPLAGVGRRLLARFLFLLGLAMMVGVGFAVLMIVPKSVTRDVYILWAIVAAFPLIYLLVNAAMLARTGQDIGKRYAGVRVVNADGGKATEVTALLKRDALTLVIGLTGIGLLYWLIDFVSLFGKGGRTLHDRIAGTRVVRA